MAEGLLREADSENESCSFDTPGAYEIGLKYTVTVTHGDGRVEAVSDEASVTLTVVRATLETLNFVSPCQGVMKSNNQGWTSDGTP